MSRRCAREGVRWQRISGDARGDTDPLQWRAWWIQDVRDPAAAFGNGAGLVHPVKRKEAGQFRRQRPLPLPRGAR